MSTVTPQSSDVSTAPPARANARANSHANLLVPARYQTIIQIGWWLLFGVLVVLNLIAIPLNFQALQRECVGGICVDQQLNFLQLRQWLALGWSRESYALVAMLINVLPVVTFTSVAVVLYLSKPHSRIVLFTSLALLLFGGATYPAWLKVIARDNALWWAPVLALNYIGSVAVLGFFYVFPDGRFVPRWTRVAFVIWGLEQFLEVLDQPPINWNFLPLWFLTGSFLVALATAIAAQIYRYRRHSPGAERRQTKWVVFAITTALTGLIVAFLIYGIYPSLQESVVADTFLSLVIAVFMSLIPISIGIAMLRSRLWDIDLILNRTFVYGIVTALLAGILAVSSDLAKRFFLALTGETTDLAPMLATLVVVAAFEPIRKRVQGFADKHFKYAVGTFGAFAHELEAFVQLNEPEALARRFLKEAVNTFEPEGGAVYLGQGSQLRAVGTVGTWTGTAALAVPLAYGGTTVGLVALGERSDGEDYQPEHRANLEQTAALVAHAIELARHLEHEHTAVQSQTG